jgi:hypothetical protein
MSLSKKWLLLAVPALLALGGCATGFPAQVSRFQAMPAPQGQSFVIQAADPRDRGGIEFGQYAELVRRHLIGFGYSEAASPESATLLVSFDYGVDNGRDQIVSWPSPPYFGGFGYGFYGRRGLYGRRYPFGWGWGDPFWGFGDDIDVYTVYTAALDLDIKRTADGQSVFEGHARARSRSDQLPVLVPNLVEAMFTGFPGNSGETVKITIPPPARKR